MSIKPVGFGLAWTPPALILHYVDPDGVERIHLFEMERRLNRSMDPRRIAVDLQEDYPNYLGGRETGIRTDQLTKLVQRLMINRGKPSRFNRDVLTNPDASATSSSTSPPSTAESESGSRRSSRLPALSRRRALSDDEDDLSLGLSPAKGKLNILHSPTKTPTKTPPSSEERSGGRGRGGGGGIYIPSSDPDPDDLNRVDSETLARAKAEMDKTFMRNRKTKDDPDFQYDVRVPVPKQQVPSDWDD